MQLTKKQKIIIGSIVGTVVAAVGIFLIIWFLVIKKSDASASAPTSAPTSAPRDWPSNVYIFDTSMTNDSIQAIIDKEFEVLGGNSPAFNGQFSDHRVSFLFKPGEYSVAVKVGFYTSVIGLGKTPDETIILGGVFVLDGGETPSPGSLDNFWRSVENVTIRLSEPIKDQITSLANIWAVSQACPLRSCIFDTGLHLFSVPPIPPGGNAGETSGGFAANCIIKEDIKLGSQQQFCFRNVEFPSGVWAGGGLWNTVFVECKNDTKTACDPSNHGQPTTPSNYVSISPGFKMAEKPYLIADDTKSGLSTYSLIVPAYEANSGYVTDLSTTARTITQENIYLAVATLDTAETINNELAKGKNVILTPGIYKLDVPIAITRKDTVVYGMGMATLIPTDGKSCITVGDVEGVRISGIIVQAGKSNSSTLMQVGQSTSFGNVDNPTIIYDIFGRVGGPDTTTVSATTMLEVNQKYVIIDNTWNWLADHGVDPSVIGWNLNTCDHGLVVNGDNVRGVGVACEHTKKDLCQWNGDNGHLAFFQSEFNYVVPSGADTTTYEDVAAVRVGSNVSKFEGYGLGAYCFFNDGDVQLKNAFQVDANAGQIQIVNPFTVYLGTSKPGAILNIVNDVGGRNPPSGQTPETAYVVTLDTTDCTFTL